MWFLTKLFLRQVCEYHTVYEEVCYDERVKVCENFWKEDGYGGKIWSEDPSKCHWLDHSQCVKTPKPKKVKLQMI